MKEFYFEPETLFLLEDPLHVICSSGYYADSVSNEEISEFDDIF